MTNGVTSTAAAGGQAPNGNFEKRLAAIEAVLPTLATKADLAELRAEMRVQNEQLRAEMRVQNEQLRTEMKVQNEQLRTEMQRILAGLYKWMLATILTIIIVGIGLGNIVISRVSVPGAARTSTSIGAGAAPAATARVHNPFPVRLAA
jgi:hypothetical protein